MAHQIKKPRVEISRENFWTTKSIFLQLSLQTSLILADKGSPFGWDDNKLSIQLKRRPRLNIIKI